MSQPTLDPTDFATRLDRSFGTEPGHAPIEDDLRVGRRRLRRHRALTGLGGVAVAAVAAGALLVAPGLLPHPASDLQAASAPLADADVVHDCVAFNDTTSGGAPDARGNPTADMVLSRAEVVARMGRARLMTRSDTGTETLATVRSEDRGSWIDCTLSRRHGEPLKAFTRVYRTAVTFPATVVDGVHAYEPHSESDPRLTGTATPPVPQFQVACEVDQQEETPAYDKAAAGCPTYTLTWNDRRPAEVAAATVVAPDGTVLHADVRDGYLSLAHSGRMTPAMAAQVARGETPRLRRVTFYDTHGRVLVTDRDPGHLPVDGHLAMENFPSLAWWLQR